MKVRSTKQNPIVGYKVFTIDNHGKLDCPHYTRPKDWKIHRGAFLTASLRKHDIDCYRGVSFWNELKYAHNDMVFRDIRSAFEGICTYCVWKIEVPPGHIVYQYEHGSRASKVKLIKRIQ